MVYQAFGFYRILPLTKVVVVRSQEPTLPPSTSLTSDGVCSGLTIGSYNIENFWPGDAAHVQAVAQHIVEFLKTPDLIFLQEVQDDNGATNDGTVSSDLTLSTLAAAIETASGGIGYNFTYVAPVNNKDGVAPGGNIRTAYLFRRDVLALRDPNPADSTTTNEVLLGGALKYNPGLIDPNNAAFANSRKPLAAAWQTLDGNNTFCTVNVHWGSKGGSSSIHGDARPPVNGGVEDRIAQAEVTAVSVFSLTPLSTPQIVSTARLTHLLFVFLGIHRGNPGRGPRGPHHLVGRLQRVPVCQAHYRLRVAFPDGRPRCRRRHRRPRAVQLPVRHEHPGARPHVR